ncbi:MAG: 50S ribosomal protein L15 [Deltaproteobacteria bacterium]|nr:50S ribosomal protein L15 [Deltaproteobacteria bacterium]
MSLNELSPAIGARKNRKRLGRGMASGTGKTSGKGAKGQKARSGGGVRPGFEGGQMPIHRRLPKRGFTNIFKKVYAIVNLSELAAFEAGAVVDEASLIQRGIVKGKFDAIKILANGEITSSITLKIGHISTSAKAKIEAAGGTVEVTA